MASSALCRLLVAAAIAAVVDARSSIPTFAGPYIAYSDRFYPCPATGRDVTQIVIRHTHFNPARPNERQLLTGFVNNVEVFNDTLGATVDMAVRSNNQWKEHAFIFKFPVSACSAFRSNIPDLFRGFFRNKLEGVLDTRKPCVIPPGNYTFDKEPVSWVFPNFPVMPYGRYRFKLTVGPRAATITTVCIQTECHVIPKANN